jgi:hypothetical protein
MDCDDEEYTLWRIKKRVEVHETAGIVPDKGMESKNIPARRYGPEIY